MKSSNISAPKIPNMDLSADAVTPPVILDQDIGCAIQAVVTGASANGAFTVEVSVDQGTDQQGSGVTNWTTMSSSSQTVVGAGTFVWNINWTYFKWIRLKFTRASGTGTAVINIQTKGIN